jgi:hypothetical protein
MVGELLADLYMLFHEFCIVCCFFYLLEGLLTIMTSYDVNVPWFINLIKSTTIKCRFCWLIFHFSLRTTAFCIILCVNVSFAFGHGSYTWQNLYNTFKHNLYTTFTYPLHNLYHSQSPNVVGFSVSSAVLLNIPGSGLEVAEMIGYAYAVWLGRGTGQRRKVKKRWDELVNVHG